MIKDQITSETSKVDWAAVLLDENTDDMIITVSREKIAHDILALREENKKLKEQKSQAITLDTNILSPSMSQAYGSS